MSIAAGFVVVGMTSALYALHPGKSLIEILISCFGKKAGKVIGFGYFLFSVWLSGSVMITFSYYNNSMSYPDTPILFISICDMLAIAFVIKLGLEVICRISEVYILIILMISLITLFSFITSFHPDAIFPLFKDGIGKPLLSGIISSLLPFAEFFLALNILPNLNDQKSVRSVGRNAVLIAGGLMLFISMRNICVLGVDVTARDIYPSEKVFKLLPSINIIPLLDINTIISGGIKVSFILYAEARILGDLFELKDFKIFVLPLAALDVACSVFIDDNTFSQIFVASKIVPLAYIPILIIMPIIMLIVSLIKKAQARLPAGF